ncbi:MAG: class I SAM-dependent methyltransferase [Chloroflexi bacterium]|nr:class I SAM-dependent methyltransferase [Chloroflexota bacterium]MCI0649569.1 class I SAM-dependent methyltransferase [Chloroflexota bacterium]MCI0729355.1 class I SAM-dependent methyltransferase [Chloroflexota bacterium]
MRSRDKLWSDPSPVLPAEAMRHYEQQMDEAGRLSRVRAEIELVRVRELLRRYLPPPPAVVLDVGGAAGIHAFWLAEQGYTVYLIDAMPHHIEQARQAAAQQPHAPLAGIALGDARRLEYPDGYTDAVLLFGPLYHLTERQDRLQALREAFRVLRPGGVVLAIGISRFISTVNCLVQEFITDPAFIPIVERDLQDGQHRNPTDNPDYFTTSFFHHPNELRQEVGQAGFQLQALLAVQGPVKLLKNFELHWQEPERREWLLTLARRLESEPHLLGVSDHIMAVGRKAASA